MVLLWFFLLASSSLRLLWKILISLLSSLAWLSWQLMVLLCFFLLALEAGFFGVFDFSTFFFGVAFLAADGFALFFLLALEAGFFGVFALTAFFTGFLTSTFASLNEPEAPVPLV